ncbi:MAG: hypothetical protein IJF12_04880 [Alphaproteobacteria bacterium]|nr:hypothetical protein [Alphaproteobacteria bacterium]
MASKTLTFDEALEVLQGDITKCAPDVLENAINVVRDKEPNHPALKTAQEVLNSNKKKFDIEDALTYSANMNDMTVKLESFDYDTFINLDENADIKSYVDIVDIKENDGNKLKAVSAKKKKEYVELLFETAKLKAQTALAGSRDYLDKSPDEKHRMLTEEIRNTFFTDFARAAIASHTKAPTKKEEKIGSRDYKQYILNQVKNAAGVFKKIIEGDKRISVKTDSILSSVADSAGQIEQYIDNLKQKAKNAGKEVKEAFTKIATSFQKKKNQLEKKANQISENRYEIFKAIKGSFSDNKIKLLGNISASTAFGIVTAGIAAGTIGAPLTAAVGAYAAYHAAGSWVYPIVAEMRKINRQRREKGQPVLGFKAQLVQAWKNKTSKDKKKNSYKTRNTYIVNGVINTGLAAIGFGCLKNGLEAIDDLRALSEGVKEGVDAASATTAVNMDIANSIAQTKHAVSMGRIAIPLAGQFTDAALTYGISLADPDDKLKAEEAKQTAVAALVGAGFSALAQGITFAASSNAADITQDITQNSSDVVEVSEAASELSANATTEKSGGFFGKIKDFFSKPKADVSIESRMPQSDESVAVTDTSALSGNYMYNSAETISDTLDMADKPLQFADSVSVEQSLMTSEVENQVLDEEIKLETTDNMGSFPDTYSENMGITQRQYNVLVNTTEGTLKSASGEEITLDRAYANLTDETMANFPNQTKEEVLYKFNRLYAFMRKAYEVGDGTLRETPSGASYLENRFETMNLSLDEHQMDSLVAFAQDNTYASSADIKTGLQELFVDKNFDDKTLSSMVTTIHSNQRFYHNAEEMEALVGMLACGETLSAEQAQKVNVLLEQTDTILKTGKENTVLTGLNLSKECSDDDGQWQKLVLPPELPVLDDNIEIADEEIVIDDTPIALDDKPVLMAKMPLRQAPLPEEEIVVVKSVSTNVHGITDPEYADKSKVLEGARANRLINKASRD